MIIIASLSHTIKCHQDMKLSPSLKGNNNGVAKHLHGVELLDRHDAVDRLLAFFEDPRTDLAVGVIAGTFAIYEVLQDFQKLGAHHGLAMVTLLHSIKAFMGVLKESKRALKGYAARFHN